MPKLGLVKFIQSRELMIGKIIRATVTHTASDKYFVSLVVKCEEIMRENGGDEIGIYCRDAEKSQSGGCNQ